MTVPRQQATGLRWKGRHYYFCDVACRDTFREDPTRWHEPVHHIENPVAPV